MIPLKLDPARRPAPAGSVPGRHSDDIEIGCGGTHSPAGARNIPTACSTGWCSAPSGCARRRRNAPRSCSRAADSERTRLSKALPRRLHAVCRRRREGSLRGAEERVSPDLIFTHNRKDAHQDHRLIAELTWNTFRNHLILEYEIPKYDGDMGQPDRVLAARRTRCVRRRCAHLMDAFQSQRSEALVPGGDIFLADAAARHGVQRSQRLCRSVLLPTRLVL